MVIMAPSSARAGLEGFFFLSSLPENLLEESMNLIWMFYRVCRRTELASLRNAPF